MNRRGWLCAVALLSLLLPGACALDASAYAQTGGGEVKPTPTRTPRKSPKTPPKPKPPAAPKSIPQADVTVVTRPAGALVLLDGQARGTSDAGGALALRALRPGTYVVTVRHNDYREARQTVSLVSGQNSPLQFSLDPLPGSLAVTLNVPDADITVSSVGSFTGRVEMPLAPGRYQIEATRPGYRKAAQAVDVHPNRPAAVSLQLDLLPAAEAIAQAELLIKNGDNGTAIRICETVLAAHGGNGPANALMGYAHHNMANFGESVRYLDSAIALGETVHLPAKVYAKTSGGEGLFAGRLTLRRGSVAFWSSERPEVGFNVPGVKLSQLKMEDKRGGRIAAEVSLLRPGQKKEKKEKIYFHAAAASGSGGSVFCGNCQQELQALLQLINRARL